MHAKEIQTELRLLEDIARWPQFSRPTPAVRLDIDCSGYRKPVSVTVYAALGENVSGCRILSNEPFDDFPEAVAAAGYAVSLLESSRIVGPANPGEGDFIKHLGRA